MTWRTRSTRFTPKTIGFSTAIQRQDRVIGCCVHRSAFALPVGTLHRRGGALTRARRNGVRHAPGTWHDLDGDDGPRRERVLYRAGLTAHAGSRGLWGRSTASNGQATLGRRPRQPALPLAGPLEAGARWCRRVQEGGAASRVM